MSQMYAGRGGRGRLAIGASRGKVRPILMN